MGERICSVNAKHVFVLQRKSNMFGEIGVTGAVTSPPKSNE